MTITKCPNCGFRYFSAILVADIFVCDSGLNFPKMLQNFVCHLFLVIFLTKRSRDLGSSQTNILHTEKNRSIKEG